MSERHPAASLVSFASALLTSAGLEPAKAEVVAEVLVEGDLLGHTTHGLALLGPYLGDIDKGRMTKAGVPRVIADLPAAVAWDAQRLPGPWVVRQAVDLATARAKVHGTCAVSIRRSHHIACLAAYLRPVAEQGLMVLLTSSDPNTTGVAPHGGRRTVMTPNPLAAAWPTDGDPVIIDVSMSITTNGLTRRLANEGKRFPAAWLVDSDGQPTDDPAAAFTDPPGALLPMGGIDHGHKGYALALMVEALTGGLAGHGRADPGEGWGATVLVQVFDPALFGGRDAFIRQSSQVAANCRATPPRPGFERVRMPGEQGLRRRREQLAHGVELYAAILPGLRPWAEKFAVPLPVPSA